MKELELPPCPFCNSLAKLHDKYLKGSANRKNWWVECTNCSCRTQDRNRTQKAIKEWRNKTQDLTLKNIKEEKNNMGKATLIINNQDKIDVLIDIGTTIEKGITITIPEESLENMDEATLERLSKALDYKKQTGYEEEVTYYTITSSGAIYREVSHHDIIDKQRYEIANAYSSKQVAKNNARADKLIRQLRRFAVEHRKNNIDWNNDNQKKYFIIYNHYSKKLDKIAMHLSQGIGSVYFDSKENAQLAIDTFYNELIWYITEYKDSL